MNSESWIILSPIEASIKLKIEAKGIPLKDWDIKISYGIKTGYNEAFIINEEKKNELLNISPENAEIIRPILRGRDIRKYKGDFAQFWIINSHNGVKDKKIPRIDLENDYPSIFKYLETYKQILENRSDKGDHWTNLRNCAYLEEFNKPKIIYPGLMRLAKSNKDDFPRFYLDENNGYQFTNDTYFMVGEDLKYLIGLLNSKLVRFLFPYYIYSFDSEGFKVFTEYLEKIPLVKTTKDKQIEFEKIVDEILLNKKNGEDTFQLEATLDKKILDMYNFTNEEIAYINKATAYSLKENL